ncbi:ROK family transcriptional regulator [Gemmata sp. JC717]|uniref:ROK family transcriptional regulator n=1 Tax=Gemmata algarum TaxID=2975278 RepID=A0ABU5F1S6_9BACT|nr:ROK family transcriptional regulator [Gemmata algarum]MDY3553964.1 ROK family transcriptional regulator [Gemmata algarum]MDY3561520.1 ROK family transcriptional regulator [Gemmata algarum]
MSAITTIRPALVGKLNERQVLRVIQLRGGLSRAEVARESGLSAPTVSKAVASLIKAGLLEETVATELARGRPAPKLRLATTSAQVLGVTIDVVHCEVVSAGLDGALRDDAITVPTPATYPELLDALEGAAKTLMARPGVATLGLGVSLPGLVDYRKGCGVLSPNVAITDNHCPAADLTERLGIECTVLQESHALCLAERHYGLAKGLDDFALLDVGAGVGLGIMSGGRLLKGRSGLAGEIGHFTAVPVGGRRCGCGNTGCLETVASDSALAWLASQKLGRAVNVDEVIDLAKSGAVDLRAELREVAGFVAVGVAAVINLFNPATVFIHTPLFEIDEALFDTVVGRARERALPPSFADCTVVRAKGSKRQGAVAGIIQHLTDSVAPELV